MMDRDQYSEANRAAWNETAPKHEQAAFQTLLKNFEQENFSTLDETAQELLRGIGLEGKDVVQIPCNNGREVLSMKRLGARRCVGFDISDAFIEQAEKLNAATGSECEFVRSDVYAIPPEYDGCFDLLYLSSGTLGWMSDLDGFFAVVRRLLRPRGWLAIYEMHPILILFETYTQDRLQIVNSYFEKQPLVDETGLDYVGDTQYESLPSYWFQHTLGDIISTILKQGLRIVSFKEYPHDVSDVFAYLAQEKQQLPLSFSLAAQVPE